jgi:tetratricopeptide (TPR) repeat protein
MHSALPPTYFVTLAETAKPALFEPQQATWMDRLEVEHPNLRAALVWSQTEAGGEAELRLVVALGHFWGRRGYLSEGRRWLAQALRTETAGVSGPHTAASRRLRAPARRRLGMLAVWQGDLAATQPAYEESLALAREFGDTVGIAGGLSKLGMLFEMRGDYVRAAALLEESLRLYRERGNTHGVSTCLLFLGTLAYKQGDCWQAGERWEESLIGYQALQDTGNIYRTLWNVIQETTHHVPDGMAHATCRACASRGRQPSSVTQFRPQ